MEPSASITNAPKEPNDVRVTGPFSRPPCIEVVDDLMAGVLRAKSPAERLAISYGMWRFARDTIRRVVAGEHPDWSDEEVKREATKRLVHGAG